MYPSMRIFTAAVVAVVFIGETIPQVRGQYERRTAIVDAVEKTKGGILQLKVVKSASWGKKEIVGTGVIVDERGYAITNHHVVADAIKVSATLWDKTVLSGEVVLEDPRYDLAILKLNTKTKLQALSFGPGSDLMVGETVIAIGNPFGYNGTVTPGIISALGRDITMPSNEVLSNLTQHSALINPGNSGGPLLNINGELIGINVALREGAQGIGFALNADTVKRFLTRHLNAGKIANVGHGLQLSEEVSPKGKTRQKVVVKAVEASSPAATAGLQKGDVIVTIGERSVSNQFDVERAFWGYKAGDTVETAILREGKLTKVALPLSHAATRVSTAR